MTMTQAETAFGGGVVLLERREGIATVTINRPSQHNALSKVTWAGIGEAVGAADTDPSVGVIVMRGAGQRAFSAGADIKEFENAPRHRGERPGPPGHRKGPAWPPSSRPRSR